MTHSVQTIVVKAPSPVRETGVPKMRDEVGFNDFDDFKVVNTTTSKLANDLAELQFHNMLVANGDAEPEDAQGRLGAIPAPAYHYVLQVTHTGGRDWSILVGLEYPQA